MKLSENKQTILSYVESRMTFIAPNLSIIVGASTAAKLMGMAGGLTNLTKMPSCNILLLGARKKLLGGFSSTAAMPHAGAIFYSKIVQDCPPVSLFKLKISKDYFYYLGSSSSCCTFSCL